MIKYLLSPGVPEFLWLCLLTIIQSMYLARLKSDIEHENAEKLESHRSQLKLESDRLIEKLSHELKVIASDRSIKLTEVFEKQADVIATTYSNIVQLLQSVNDYTMALRDSSDQQGKQIEEGYFKTWKVMISHYEQHRIYLPKHIQNDIEEFIHPLTERTIAFHLWNKCGRPHGQESNPWMEIQQFVRDGVDKPMANLDLKFKQILGLSEDK